jgi:hypothetical protein
MSAKTVNNNCRKLKNTKRFGPLWWWWWYHHRIRDTHASPVLHSQKLLKWSKRPFALVSCCFSLSLAQDRMAASAVTAEEHSGGSAGHTFLWRLDHVRRPSTHVQRPREDHEAQAQGRSGLCS